LTSATAPLAASSASPRRRLARHWIALVAGSVAGALALLWLHVTAALLFGPLAAALVLAARSSPLRVPPRALVLAQAIVGCMIARSLPLALLGEIGRGWPLFLACVASVILLAAALGWAMARWRVLPGTTAVWGAFPGAATAMVLMSEAFGADARLVAFMQYLRVLMVGVVATTVAGLWVPVHATTAPLLPPAPPVHWIALGETLALAVVGAWLARRLRITAGTLLVPMVAGVALQGTGLLAIELPWWLLAACYAVVGWSIGLRFTPQMLRHAARLLPRVVAGIALLITACGGLAWLLVRFAHVDPLTAYLATSPGGADTVAIIASGSPVDLPFVMSMQAARFMVVAFCGPALARWVARRVPG
jgi:membrane AbrB-like protein